MSDLARAFIAQLDEGDLDALAALLRPRIVDATAFTASPWLSPDEVAPACGALANASTTSHTKAVYGPRVTASGCCSTSTTSTRTSKPA